ncbi:MAG: transglycosylase domain-containing protein [Deltaproteobacteria bacterium]|nr:transglycosylase domain-containing protein [Deltaproteobacteria bacterium]
MSSLPAKLPEQDPGASAQRALRRQNWRRRRWKVALALALLVLTGLWLVRGRWAIPAHPGEVLEQYYGSTRLLDRHGRVLELWTGAAGTRHRPVTLAKVSRHLVAATLAMEDHRFWQHPGVDVFATSRAAWQNLLAGRVVSGASTLTQQLCKWLDPRPRTLSDKAMEAIEALQLEGVLSKNEILELYLSYAPYGGLQRGVEQASLAWLGKAPADVTLAEAA